MKTNKNIVTGLKVNLKPNIYLNDLEVDTRIIPLFKTPIILKKIQLIKKLNSDDAIKMHAAAQK